MSRAATANIEVLGELVYRHLDKKPVWALFEMPKVSMSMISAANSEISPQEVRKTFAKAVIDRSEFPECGSCLSQGFDCRETSVKAFRLPSLVVRSTGGGTDDVWEVNHDGFVLLESLDAWSKDDNIVTAASLATESSDGSGSGGSESILAADFAKAFFAKALEAGSIHQVSGSRSRRRRFKISLQHKDSGTDLLSGSAPPNFAEVGQVQSPMARHVQWNTGLKTDSSPEIKFRYYKPKA